MNTVRVSPVALSPMPASLLVAVTLLAACAIYVETARSIVAIWNSSETFAHGYIILPISLWLIWRRREVLAQIPLQPFWPALLLLAACGFGWLLAELGEVQVVRQYAFVAMLPLTVLAVTGPSMTRAMAFPLFYLLLAVPFGEVFVAPLINFTADFTVAALQLTGIPVLRSGSNFEIPSGSWSVVEACSGVRYLISSFTLGCLYAYLNYRSSLRRLTFVLLSIIVPIVANGGRAYMIVIIGHLSDNRLAAGVDHLIYGWVFFGLVMFLMFWAGSYWREDTPFTAPAADMPQARSRVADRGVFPIAIASIVCIGIWPAYAALTGRIPLAAGEMDPNKVDVQWPESMPFTDWKHGFSPAQAETTRFFEKDSRRVGMSVLVYRGRQDGAGLISTANRLVPTKERHWQQRSSATQNVTTGERVLDVRETRLQREGQKLLVWHWYTINGEFTASDYVGKLVLARERLFMRSNEGASIMLFAPFEEDVEGARAVMRKFLNDNVASLDASFARTRRP
ncbi:MAG TPA: exosortase A [Noviherbaspirillum sp.]|nr:exosortase A [Noviherbaspirillum sp.]